MLKATVPFRSTKLSGDELVQHLDKWPLKAAVSKTETYVPMPKQNLVNNNQLIETDIPYSDPKSLYSWRFLVGVDNLWPAGRIRPAVLKRH